MRASCSCGVSLGGAGDSSARVSTGFSSARAAKASRGIFISRGLTLSALKRSVFFLASGDNLRDGKRIPVFSPGRTLPLSRVISPRRFWFGGRRGSLALGRLRAARCRRGRRARHPEKAHDCLHPQSRRLFLLAVGPRRGRARRAGVRRQHRLAGAAQRFQDRRPDRHLQQLGGQRRGRHPPLPLRRPCPAAPRPPRHEAWPARGHPRFRTRRQAGRRLRRFRRHQQPPTRASPPP